MRAKLSKGQGRDRATQHLPIPEQGRWLASVLRGHYNYYAVPDNSEALRAFRYAVAGTGCGRSGAAASAHRMTWERMSASLIDGYLKPGSCTPGPNVRFDARTQGRSPVR